MKYDSTNQGFEPSKGVVEMLRDDSLSSTTKPAAAVSPAVARVSRWSAAALSGLSLLGCPAEKAPAEKETTKAEQPATVAAEGKDAKCCMGLNDCKGQGGCAVPESHSCAGKNECKGQGGCNMHCPK